MGRTQTWCSCGSLKDRRATRCLDCYRNRPRKVSYYEPNKDRPESQKLKSKQRVIHQRAIIAIIKLIAGCADCGYDDHACALDFDHTGDNKTRSVSHMSGQSWLKIYEEIMKCDVVCANCHRIRTWITRGKD